jgi:outer membrane protein assembly factor BamB
MVHCVDAETGRPYWVHDAGRDMWASTLVADGRVYVGTRGRQFWVLATGKEKRVLSSIELDDALISTPVAANGTLYVGTMKRLFALEKGVRGEKAQ